MPRKDSNQVVTTSFPIASILTIVFVVLKLTNNISWSWWWVVSPLWIPLGLIAILFVVVFVFLLIKAMIGLR